MNDSSGIIKPSSEREWPKAPRKRVPIYTARNHEAARDLYAKTRIPPYTMADSIRSNEQKVADKLKSARENKLSLKKTSLKKS